jgi:hypothetical protein
VQPNVYLIGVQVDQTFIATTVTVDPSITGSCNYRLDPPETPSASLGPGVVECGDTSHEYVFVGPTTGSTKFIWHTARIGLVTEWDEGPSAVLDFSVPPGDYLLGVEVDGIFQPQRVFVTGDPEDPLCDW